MHQNSHAQQEYGLHNNFPMAINSFYYGLTEKIIKQDLCIISVSKPCILLSNFYLTLLLAHRQFGLTEKIIKQDLCIISVSKPCILLSNFYLTL